MNLIDRIFNDKDGKRVYWQKPNWPIYLAAVFYVLANTVDEEALFYGQATLLIWAAMELISGVNVFRRLLGVVFVIYFGVKVIAQI